MWTVIGHEKAVALLTRSLEKGITSHAYLIVGPQHVGKMTLAVNLAQALNCEKTGAERPCQECEPCRRIRDGKHSDIQIVQMQAMGEGETAAKTRIGVEQVDQILHSVNLPPFEGKRKVFIFDGFEHTSIGASNRMLKTLEEPVSTAVFTLLTSDESRVPATIASRCQRIELFPLPLRQVEDALVGRWHVDPEKARLLARLSGGCLGLAVTMAQDEAPLRQRNEWLDEWFEMFDSDLDARFIFAARISDKFSQNRQPLLERLTLLRDLVRDVLLVRAGNAEAITNVARIDAISRLASAHNLGSSRRLVPAAPPTTDRLNRNVNPQLAIEVLMLNMRERGKVKEGEPLT